jgi:hypothetical protein
MITEGSAKIDIELGKKMSKEMDVSVFCSLK